MNVLIKLIKTCLSIVLIGGLGLLLCQTDEGGGFPYLEKEYGLDWLFKLRGTLPPPTDVVIVSIDQVSANFMHFPDDLEKWPRSYYSQFIEQVSRQNPAVIAFNLHFDESRDPEADQKLAKAIAAKKNVILSSYLKQDTAPDVSPIGEIRYEPIIGSIPLFDRAAVATAPFPLPKTSSTVKEFWKHSVGSVSTFPVTIFQYYVIKNAYPEILQLLDRIDPELRAKLPDTFALMTRKLNAEMVFQDIQNAFSKDTVWLEQLSGTIADSHYSAGVKKLLQAWLALLSSNERLYLNHYGDVGTITTVSFHQALSTGNLMPGFFRGKIVLVGYSDSIEPEKYQGFYTTFSKASGKVISPIEIAATAIANELDQSWLKPLSNSDEWLLIIAWSVLLSVIFVVFSYKISVVLALFFMVGYVAFSGYLFAAQAVWIPLAIPMIQAVFVLVLQSMTHFIKVGKVSGRYLPQGVFDDNTHNPGAMNQYGLLMHGVCMATDAGQYTALSETVNPVQLHSLMNNYYAAIFPRVKSRNGLISDVTGDAMLAIWANKKADIKLRLNACHAALEIKSAIDRFFNDNSQYQLSTRMGLHYGEMRLGNVGAMEHFEYRAVGDTVNTATRIEGLNKLLGTHILVSAPVMEALPGFFSRELGSFLLKGKTFPVTIFELIGYIDETARNKPHLQQLALLFSKALVLFKDNQWQQALDEFVAVSKAYPDDGPTQFYINYLQNQLSLSAGRFHEVPSAVIDVSKIAVLLH